MADGIARHDDLPDARVDTVRAHDDIVVFALFAQGFEEIERIGANGGDAIGHAVARSVARDRVDPRGRSDLERASGQSLPPSEILKPYLVPEEAATKPKGRKRAA